MNEFQNLSENELQAMIVNAKKALEIMKSGRRKEVIAQIRELAASINVTVEIHENDKNSARKGIKVADKYVHPEDPSKRWTGRGVAPKWMQELIEHGHKKEEFQI